jgi:hypothetical protein
MQCPAELEKFVYTVDPHPPASLADPESVDAHKQWMNGQGRKVDERVVPGSGSWTPEWQTRRAHAHLARLSYPSPHTSGIAMHEQGVASYME